MKCPFCGDVEDRVIDSRPAQDGRAIRRRRECLECRKRFTTYEYVEELQLVVMKRDEKREPFDRSKLMSSVMLATAKRPVAAGVIDSIVERVQSELHAQPKREVTSRLIGELVMQELRQIDQVAYIRYASVYRHFKAVGDFTEEVRKLS